MLVTYAMFLILEDVTKLVWGANPYYVSEPYGLFGNIDIGQQTYVGYDFMLVELAVGIGLAVWWGLNRTRPNNVQPRSAAAAGDGRFLRATSASAAATNSSTRCDPRSPAVRLRTAAVPSATSRSPTATRPR